jgi:hypothetical protein
MKHLIQLFPVLILVPQKKSKSLIFFGKKTLFKVFFLNNFNWTI